MLTFNADRHEYRWNNRVVPSVTQILSRVGVRKGDDDYWCSLSGSEHIRDNVAADFGTAFHRYVELRLKGYEVDFDLVMEPWVNSWEMWYQVTPRLTVPHNDAPLIEYPMYCERYGYALTPDWVAADSRWLAVVDWKTSTTWQDHWWWQLGAYAKAVELLTGHRRLRTMIVRVKENEFPEVQEHSAAQVAVDFNRFLSVRNVYKLAA